MDDRLALEKLNERFIEAFRQGLWELLEPILAPSFSYLDGASGEVWEHDRYVDTLRSHPAPALALDQVVIHLDGDTAVISGRTSREPRSFRRYLDTYERTVEGWRCVHACPGRSRRRRESGGTDPDLIQGDKLGERQLTGPLCRVGCSHVRPARSGAAPAFGRTFAALSML